jgi:hypothetical protein
MRVSLVFSLLLTTVGLSALDAQHYTISTYAGGAPVPPTAAISMAVDPAASLYFVDGYGFTSNPSRGDSVFKIDPGGRITRFAGNQRIRRVSPDGTITTVAGGGPDHPVDGAPATSVRLAAVVRVPVDGAGNLFLIDEGWDPSGNLYFVDGYGFSINVALNQSAVSYPISNIGMKTALLGRKETQ